MYISICAAYMLYEQNCWMLVEQREDAAFGCLRAAPLLQGLVVKSGHKQVFSPLPPSFSPFSPLLSACSLVFYLSAPAHIPTLSPATDSFFISSLLCLHAAECRAEASACIPLLSDCISSLSILLSLSVSSLLSPLCSSLYAHICDQIMRHIMGLVSLMACIKVGELRDG